MWTIILNFLPKRICTMANLREQYKNPPLRFGNTDQNRIIRAYNREKLRKEIRAQDFAKNRKLQVEKTPTIANERAKKLKKWKEERDRKKKLEDTKKKPAFKVGIVHHAIYSPASKHNSVPAATKSSNQVKHPNIVQKRITRATEKRLLAKAAQVTVCNVNNTMLEVKEIITIESSSNEQNKEKSPEAETSSSNNKMETPTQKTSVNNKSSEKENFTRDLIFFSPYITLSRGKKNARKEQMLKLGISSLPSDIPTKDTVMKNLNISIEEEERTAQYFKFLLNKEIDRLEELCTKWLDIRLEKDVPEDAMYEISQAVGQTKLLISKKFERFRGLVSDCESGKGHMLVTCKDLQGFWDMTCMEVRDCDLRFEKLEQRRSRGWQEELSTIVVKPTTKKRMPAKKQVVPSKPSSLRSLISAARRKKMAETSSMEVTLLQDNYINHLVSLPSIQFVTSGENIDTRHDTRKSKSLDGNGFKSIPAKRDSLRASSVKHEKVQFSDSIKKMRSPLAVIKISKMCKTPEIQLDDRISYINSDQTPGKGILKKTEEINKEARVKSAHKVIFDDQVASTAVSDDEKSQTKRELATVSSNRIDSLDLDDLSPQVIINAEKQLIFETEDSDVSSSSETSLLDALAQLKENKNTSTSLVQNVPHSNMSILNDIISTSFKEISPKDNMKTKSSRRSLRRQSEHKSTINNDMMKIPSITFVTATSLQTNSQTPIIPVTSMIPETIPSAENLEQEPSLGIRKLRNRIVTLNDTPKSKRASLMMTSKKRSISKNETHVQNLTYTVNDTPKTKRTSIMMTPKKRSISKENETAMTSSKKMLLKLSHTDESTQSDVNGDINRSVNKQRKSSRKSVAYDVEACVACTENKPVLPMTHTKQNTPSRRC